MALSDVWALAATPAFAQRVQAQLVASAIAAFTEATNEVQTITVTGTPTGGSFTLASLPGSQTLNQNGATTSAAATITGLSSTQGLFVGMSVTGQGVAAGATIATITSLTALTLSANSSASATVPLTFSGVPVTSIPFNAGAADVQAILQALPQIGNDDIVTGGGPLPGTPITVTFCGIFGFNPQRLMTLGTNSLTGGSTPTAAMTRTTAGTVGQPNHTKRAARASQILNNPSGYATMYTFGVAADATVQSDYTGGGSNQSSVTDAHIASAVSSIYNAYLS